MNIVDKFIDAVSPAAGKRRAESRLAAARAEAVTEVIRAYGYSSGGASRSKASMKGWDYSSASPQKDIDANLKTLRERSRSLYYNAPVATSAINRNLVHVIGSGLHASPKIAWRRLGITKERADEIAADVKFKFNAWAESKDCDVTGQNNFYELQQIGMLTWLLGGEFFGLPAYIDNGHPIELCMRLVEGDLCCNPNGLSGSAGIDSKNEETGNRIRNGIEIDDQGRVVAYHFVKGYRDQITQREWVRVPARGDATGNPNVLHVFNAIRPTQYRGVPYLAPVIESIKQLTRYTEAEIMAAVINGLFSVFVTTEDGQTPDLGAYISDINPDGGYPEGEYPGDDDELALGNGNIAFLKTGESVQVVDAKRPNSNFDGFMGAMAKHIGAALNVPAELLLMQFTASYSASRGALLEAWNFFSLNREWFAADFCQPVYEMWLAEAVSKGLVDMPGFFADEYTRAAWSGANWTGPAPGQLNPTVEVNAAVAKMNAGLSTGEREALAMNGSDYTENIEQLATERALRIDQGMEKQDDQNQS